MSIELNKPTCEQLIDIIPDPFVIIDRHYTIQAANQAYLRRYQVRREDVVGRKCHEISHHSNLPCSQCGEHCPLETVFATRQPAQALHVHYHKNGDEDRVRVHGAPIFGPDGEVHYMGEYIYPLVETAEDDSLVGRSSAWLATLHLLECVASTHTTVLLSGESGVGKERLAEYIHRRSPRSRGPYVVLDCAALSENLIERELFGHEKGAFTGATHRQRGLFEAAHGGTLFIDEIGELPLALQPKLLRVLETGTIRRLGGTEYRRVDVRVIAATNRDLKAMVRSGRFREDLYYRLSAFPVSVPPLRERKEDIPRLAEFFLARLPEGRRHLPLDAAVLARLMTYDYPGNVRELKNIIERAYLLAGADRIRPVHIHFEACEPRCSREDGSETSTVEAGLARVSASAARRLRDEDILRALAETHGHRQRAAQLLGISERTLYRQIHRLRQRSQKNMDQAPIRSPFLAKTPKRDSSSFL
jgi:transcriptional regulator with GAF, ATPase, and Fis domain